MSPADMPGTPNAPDAGRPAPPALLVRGGQVLAGSPPSLIRADVLVDGDRIAAIEPSVPTPEGAHVLDAAGSLVLPGLVNAHTHAASHLVRGTAGDWTLEDLINHAGASYGFRSPEDQYLSAAIGAIEMLKTGTTAAYDLFMAVPAITEEAIEAVVRAYADSGMRAVVAPAVADVVFYQTVPGLIDLLPDDLRRTVEGMQAAPTRALLDLTETVIRRFHGAAEGRIRAAVSPTIPNQATDEFLRGAARLVRDYGVSVHTHLAESKVQVIESARRFGKSIVGRLGDVGLLGPGFVGAHGVWLTDDDIRRLADAGAAVAHNPGSNLRLGCGIAAVREMLDRGLAVGLGTDGSVCSDNQNGFEALRFASVVSTIRFPHRPERWLGARTVWTIATAGGARVLGLTDDIGALAPGRKADLVLLRADAVFLRPMGDVLSALVYAETGANVHTVVVDGRVVVEGGRVLTLDEARIYTRVQEAADAHRRRSAEAWALADRLTPYLAAACRAAVARPFPVNRYAADPAGAA